MSGNEREEIVRYVIAELRAENMWTKLWSALHHGFTFSAIILSAAAALILQLESVGMEDATRTDVAAVLAAAASLIGIISTSGGFARKWRANRITKGTLEQIQIELLNPECDLDQVRAGLKK